MRREMKMMGAILGASVGLVLLAVDLSVARVVFALAICLLLPGLGWARKMRYADLGDTLAMACVLSICTTVAVGTVMVLSRSWWPQWGLAVLAGIALVGFVPARQLLDRASAALRLRIAGFSDDGGTWADWYRQSQDQAAARQARASEASGVWVDWYSDVERRSAEAREREAAAKQAAVEAWISWYQQTHLLNKRSGTRS
jgi:hypothetical protein